MTDMERGDALLLLKAELIKVISSLRLKIQCGGKDIQKEYQRIFDTLELSGRAIKSLESENNKLADAIKAAIPLIRHDNGFVGRKEIQAIEILSKAER